jgi:hypothetical protein
MEPEEAKRKLIEELKKGENSPLIKNFDWKKFLEDLNNKYRDSKPETGNGKQETTS